MDMVLSSTIIISKQRREMAYVQTNTIALVNNQSKFKWDRN